MRGSAFSRVFILIVSGILAAPAAAEVVPGDLLVIELGSSDRVVNIRGGGDFSGAPPFATGLTDPIGICRGPGGDIYVSEFNSTEVTIVTEGGDFTGAPAFATGLGRPDLLSCNDQQILVHEVTGGEITDITAGGDFTGVAPFISGLGAEQSVRLVRDSSGTLWVSSSDGATSTVRDLTAGGDASLVAPFVTGVGFVRGIAEWEGALLVSLVEGRVVDVTAGGDMATLPDFATVFTSGFLLAVPGLGLFDSSPNLDRVWEISDGADYGFATPGFAEGLDEPLAMAYVAGCGDGVVQGELGEECDDGNTVAGDGCEVSCTFVPEPAAPLLLMVGTAVMLAGARRRPHDAARRG